MDIYEEAIQMIETNKIKRFRVYKLIEKDYYLSKLFWFKGDKVKYNKGEYEKLKAEIQNRK